MTNDIQKQIAATFYFDHLPEAQQEEMLAQVGEVVFKGVMIQALEQLPEESQAELGAMFDNNAEPQQVVDYLKARLTNFEQVVISEIEALKKEVDGLATEAQTQIA